MANQELYSDHLDALLALVTHLAMTRYKSRTPTKLARYLSLDHDEVLLVLEKFKGLFRKSESTSKESKEYYYTLQLRYARRWLDEEERKVDVADGLGIDDKAEEDNPEPREPLEAAYLGALLDFI